ncbi:hypothetical protein ACIQU5_23000 [Streptomyces sp. NPDC090306]|uniref:hypothetical protein n=1 Tax=Streptomyces sp. NPDC090306 TaxID=3365961 RepID=UPI0037F97F25
MASRASTRPDREPSLLPVLGVFAVLAVVLERLRSFMGKSTMYILCDDVGGLSAQLGHEVNLNRWFLLAGLLLSVAVAIASRVRRWRVLAAFGLFAVVVLLVLADGFAVRADAVAERIAATQHCDEPTNIHDTSPGWFDWSPLGP